MSATSSPRSARKSNATSSSPSSNSKLEIIHLTDDIADDRVACDCQEDSRPSSDEEGAICVFCSKWFHMQCMLGVNHAFKPADHKNGYKCRPCRQARRAAAARDGYEKLHGAGSTNSMPRKYESLRTSTPSKGGNLGSAPRKSALSVPPSAKDVAHNILGRASGGRPSLGRAAKKPTVPKDDEDEDDEDKYEIMGDDDDAYGGDEGSSNMQDTPSKYMTRARRATLTDPQPRSSPLSRGPAPPKNTRDIIKDWQKGVAQPKKPQKTLDDVIKEWEKKPKHNKVVCTCPGGASTSLFDYRTCHSCKHLAHIDCQLGGVLHPESTEPKTNHCALCRKRKLKQRQQLIEQNHLRLQQAAVQQQRTIRHFTTTTLWKLYCALPPGESNGAVQELTSTYYEKGRMLPIHPAPEGWVKRVSSDLFKMVNAAGNDKLRESKGPDGTQLRYDERSMTGWRKLACWVLHHGEYKGKRSELGVWGEVLGLEEKGHHWKA